MRPILFLALLPACTITGSGTSAEDTRDLDAFDQVVAQASVDVELVETPSHGATVRCDDNLVDRIRTEVRDDVLTVWTNGALNPQTRCEVTLTTPQLEQVTLEGSGDVTSDDTWTAFEAATSTGSGTLSLEGVDGGDVTLAVEGSGDLVVAVLTGDEVLVTSEGSGTLTAGGTARSVGLTLEGSGDVELQELGATTAEITHGGSGRADVRASERFTGTLRGSGDLHLWGGGTNEIVDNGSGDVIEE